MVKEGGAYYIRTGFFEHLQERILVDRLYTQRLGDMTEGDAAKEGTESLDDFIKEGETLSGSWNPEAVVWVAEFHLDKDHVPTVVG